MLAVKFSAFLLPVMLLAGLAALPGQGAHPFTWDTCSPVGANRLNTSLCNEQMKNQAAFQDFLNKLRAPTSHPQTDIAVAYKLALMYRYLHCSDELEAVSVLFYNSTKNQLAHLEHSYTEAASAFLPMMQTRAGLPLVGRRRRQTQANGELSEDFQLQEIDNITKATSPACIQWLINQLIDVGSMQFHTAYPLFPNPSAYLLTNIHHQPTASVASMSGTVKYNQTCFVCNGLDCLVVPESSTLQHCPDVRPLCTTHVWEADHGRDIDRGCASVDTCNNDIAANPEVCNQTESQQLPWHTSCRYCCNGYGCNAPPRIIPPAGTTWHAPGP